MRYEDEAQKRKRIEGEEKFNRLFKQPQTSTLARDRKLITPKTGKQRKSCQGKHDLKDSKKGCAKRLREFKDQGLQVSPSCNKLWCSWCRVDISTKKSNVETHIKSGRHVKNTSRKEIESARNSEIITYIDNQEDRRNGDTLPMVMYFKYNL